MHWYVIYTKARTEKKTAVRLEQQGFEVYCPLKEETRQWSDRRKKVKIPVFNSYVFVHLNSYASENMDILQIPGVVRFLWWLGKPAIVRDEEIRTLKQFLEDYQGSEIEVSYQKGEQVKITEGPFKEFKGIIIDTGKRKARLYIKSLGISLKAQLPLSALKKSSSQFVAKKVKE